LGFPFFFLSVTEFAVQVPKDNKCPLLAIDCCTDWSTLSSGLDCKQLLEAVKEKFSGNGMRFELSNDPGRYLCAYSYYISLRHNRHRSLFVHVPEFDEYCTKEFIANIIKQIIHKSMLQVLALREKRSTNSDDKEQQQQPKQAASGQ
uniref:Peptidase C15, pyroglutamyl peptidase I-like protein n=1 Tax=Gongylonema pulchrum TaxID=637853 RepID=A0A183DER0_9BILA